ncbi:5-(carboxyamino)imidazole ribonucleotide synthase [Solwaraspora sp. WMMD1047]|uniref:5-(carboxyamino)imidazole ribonucleotide synthase n=1 Tax=Solwaraspora sp. WMMD1047 TaxID=3016102 RepID=UPI002417AAC2|nr:5-(carboxyamino)imidazole ribonucleotide synthase [Solwaraspora sp. WMMD1047]MDG4828672.1 5-(carboxyamino)imidazole ribonucleotide synthase [Solwaraspora sp. WMMD1047]
MDSRTGLPVVGMVGGGQLARMTHQAAIALGQSLRVLALTPEDGAALVAADVRYGEHTDLAALRMFAKGCDVVTFDHEHVPAGHLRALAADGVALYPGPDALRYAQDKRAMRERLAALGAPVPRWRPVTEPADVCAFGAEVGWPVVVKAARGGYDGRGVWFVAGPGPATEQVTTLLAGGTPLIVEEAVPLRRELAVQVARSPFGQVAAYPVVETVQRDGICVEVLAPAPALAEELALRAQRLAIDLATELGVVGLLAVELFETTDDGGLVVNELAMRPHNSGHWTIEGARTSQFEQHLRAVLDYPMGDTSLTAPAVVMANVLGGADGGMSIDERLHHLFAEEPGAKVHLYGKQVRPGRKIGHVTVLGDDLASVRDRAVRSARWLREGR